MATQRSALVSRSNVLWHRDCPNCAKQAYAFDTKTFGVVEVCVSGCGFAVFPAVNSHLEEGYAIDLRYAVQLRDDLPIGGDPGMDVSPYVYQCEKNHTSLSFQGIRESGMAVLVCKNLDLIVRKNSTLGNMEVVGSGEICGLEYELPPGSLPAEWLASFEKEGGFFNVIKSPQGHEVVMPFLWAMFMTKAGVYCEWDILTVWQNVSGSAPAKQP